MAPRAATLAGRLRKAKTSMNGYFRFPLAIVWALFATRTPTIGQEFDAKVDRLLNLLKRVHAVEPVGGVEPAGHDEPVEFSLTDQPSPTAPAVHRASPWSGHPATAPGKAPLAPPAHGGGGRPSYHGGSKYHGQDPTRVPGASEPDIP